MEKIWTVNGIKTEVCFPDRGTLTLNLAQLLIDYSTPHLIH